MRVSVGTFNLNNLYSRWNFAGEISAIQKKQSDVNATVTYSFDAPATYKIRTYEGKLIKGKSEAERAAIVGRIKRMNLDILAVQEVEDIDTLRSFNQNELAGLHPFQVLVEGNDPRFIDVGLLSKLPVGAITSWRYAVHKDDCSEPVFSRDLLEVEIWDPARSERLFTLFNNHLKSQYVPEDEDPVQGKLKADLRRKRQAETEARIVEARMRPNDKYIILGDMNDGPDSEQLAALVDSPVLTLTNALANPTETRPAKKDNPPPSTKAWTHRFKSPGQPAQYTLFDQIWLSPALVARQQEAWIDRRIHHSGDGSDHDPAWVVLEL
jgi:endonuclease/exonuclease/phosphatase family metal-dependent hydrolase